MQLQKILVILDRSSFNKDEIALKRAISLVSNTEATIHIVAFCYDALIDKSDIALNLDRDAVKEQLIRDTAERLEQMLAAYRESSEIPITSAAAWAKHPHEWIKDQGVNYDLAIKTSQREKTKIFTPSDWHLLRNNHIPLLLASGKQWKKNKHHVVATIDLASKNKVQQELNHKVAHYAKHMAELLGSELHVVYALPISKVLKELDLIESRDEERKFIKEHRSQVDALAQELGIPVEHIHIRAGDPNRVISGISKKIKAQLIVIGTVARRGIKGALIGNTAEQVLQGSSIDVLALRPD